MGNLSHLKMLPFSTRFSKPDHLLLPTPQTTTTHSRRLCVFLLTSLSRISFEFGLCHPSHLSRWFLSHHNVQLDVWRSQEPEQRTTGRIQWPRHPTITYPRLEHQGSSWPFPFCFIARPKKSCPTSNMHPLPAHPPPF